MELNSQMKQLILEDNKVIINDTTGHLSPFIAKIDDLTGIEIFLPEDILDSTQEVYVLFKTKLDTKNFTNVTCAKKFRNCYSEKLVDFIEELDEFAEYFNEVNIEKKYYNLAPAPKKSKSPKMFTAVFILISLSLLIFKP